MTVLYRCDGCETTIRSSAWTALDGWLVPNGWLTSTHGYHACGIACANKVDSKVAYETPAHVEKQMVKVTSGKLRVVKEIKDP